MSIEVFKRLGWFVVLCLAQVLILNYIHLFDIAIPLLYVYFTITFRRGMPKWVILLWSFALGLAIDVFSNTPGLASGSMTLIAVIQPYLLELFPGAFSAHSREELLKNTREILWPQIVAALTGKFTADELKDSEKAADGSEIIYSGNLDEVNLYFSQNGWTDGLPIIPPTTSRVDEFLKYTDLEPDKVIAAIPPTCRRATARLVAVNGVMAGCPPEYMPILIAFTRAMTNGDFRRTLASTHA